MQSPGSERKSVKKLRSQTFSNDSANKIICGLLVLHRDGEIQKKIAKHKCHLLGYKPLTLARPTHANEDPNTTIARIKQLLGQRKDTEVAFVLVEGNYSNPTSATPNADLIKYFCTFLPTQRIFITSSTEACIANIKANPEFEGVMISDPSYGILALSLPSLRQEHDLTREPAKNSQRIMKSVSL